MNQNLSVIEFKVLGGNCIDVGFILAGLDGTEGVRVCKEIEEAINQGSLDIDVQSEQIYFFCRGSMHTFFADKERLLAIEQMLINGRVQREPYQDLNYHGFKLTRKL